MNKAYVGDTVSVLARELLRKHLTHDRSALKILDTGTSSGSFCNMLATEGFREIYAVDIDDYRSDDVLAADVIKEFKTADLSTDMLPWPDDFFDAITGWCIVPHLENPHHFIREAHRTLKKKGYLFMSMPHVTSLFARKRFFRHGEIERYSAENDHIAILTPALVQKTILKYFDLAEIAYFIDIEKIARGRFGWLKKLALTKDWHYRKAFEKLYGHNIVYVLTKRDH